MATIPGASGYLNSATLANRQGLSAQSASLLGDGGIGGVDILDVARANAPSDGVGLSSRARLLNSQFLDSTATTFNQIFSLGLGATASVDGLQQQILALRSRTPEGGLSRELAAEANSAAEDANAEPAQPVDPAEAAANAEVDAIRQKLTDSVQATLSSLSVNRGIDTEA